MISGNQIKAARALIGIDQESLALAAGICPQTLVHLESSGAAQRWAARLLLNPS
jgi:DNA-binding XRE family transcriptional regulator